MKRRFFTTAWVLAFCFGAASAFAAALPDSVKALIPAAESEKSLVVFGTTMNPRQVRAYADSFNAFYGTKIKLAIVGGLHSQKVSEIIMATKSNVPAGIDIFWSGASGELIEPGAVIPVNWVNELGVRPDLQMGNYGLRTHDGHPTMVTINTKLTNLTDGPKTYDDLLDPKWQGKMAMPRSAAPWVFLSYAMGEDKVTDLLTRLLSEQQPKMLARYADIRTRVIGGEFPVAFGTDAFTQIQQGAPIVHAAMDQLVLSSTGVFIVTGTKSPNAAKLFGYWAVSPEGQKVMEEARASSLVETPGTALNEYSKGKKVVHVPFEWRLENFNRLQKKYQTILERAGSSGSAAASGDAEE